MSVIRVLVIDDSSFTRKALTRMLGKGEGIQVVGEAEDGEQGLRKVESLKPDVITMDLDMPRMDGFAAIAEIRRRGLATPILVVSGLSREKADATVRAFELGATDFIPKPSGDDALSLDAIQRSFLAKVRAVGTKRTAVSPLPTKPPAPAVQRAGPRGGIRLVVIGASTGGPQAVATILKSLPRNFQVPIVIAQHMPAVFTSSLARWLARVCPLPTSEAQGGESVLDRQAVFLGPGDRHILLRKIGDGVRVEISEDKLGQTYLPSVNLLFETACQSVGPRHLLAVVLSGMGNDGAQGAAIVHQGGGHVIVQDEASSAVWGMPGAVHSDGHADEVLPADRIAEALGTRLARDGKT